MNVIIKVYYENIKGYIQYESPAPVCQYDSRPPPPPTAGSREAEDKRGRSGQLSEAETNKILCTSKYLSMLLVNRPTLRQPTRPPPI
jgi:hypothetical protein